MKRILRIIIPLVLIAVFQLVDHAAAADDGWKLKKRQDGVYAFLRDYPGSGLKEFRGVMYVKGVRLSSMVATFDDTASYPRWMHNCIESKLLKYMNVRERITYTVTHAPWPASDRDVIVYSLMTQDPGDLSVTIAITGRPDYMPPQKGRLRIPMMKASWTFRPLKTGDVMVVYQTVTDPGGPLPLSLLNLSVVDLPFLTMQKFRNVVRDDRYAAAIYQVISEPMVN